MIGNFINKESGKVTESRKEIQRRFFAKIGMNLFIMCNRWCHIKYRRMYRA